MAPNQKKKSGSKGSKGSASSRNRGGSARPATGRVTPKGTAPAGPRRRVGAEEDTPLPQVGRQPPNPFMVLLIAAVWIACGIFALVGLSASWRLIPGIVFIGIGLLFARGGLTALARRDR